MYVLQVNYEGHVFSIIRSSAIAETAGVTIRSVIALYQLVVIVTLNVTHVNVMLVTVLSIGGRT